MQKNYFSLACNKILCKFAKISIMKKIFTLIFCMMIALAGIAQDTINWQEAADTIIHVADEAVHSAPQSGKVIDWLLWGAAVISLILGLINYFKNKKIK